VYHNHGASDNGWRIPECTAAFDFVAQCCPRSRKSVPSGPASGAGEIIRSALVSYAAMEICRPQHVGETLPESAPYCGRQEHSSRRDAPNGRGVAQFEGAFDLDLIQVCDGLPVDSPGVLGFAKGPALHVTLFPFPSRNCNCGRGGVRESVGFKSETCVDDSMGAAQIRVPFPSLCLAP
jgi:hypothetical protein